MITSRVPRLTVCAAAAVLLAGCGGGDDAASSTSSSSSSSTSSSSSSSSATASPGSGGTDLAPGLLPAEAFGPDAQVTPLTKAQLAQGAALAGGSTEGLQVTPPECTDAVLRSQPAFDEYDDVAAQVAVLGTTTTVEALVSGGPATEAVADLGSPPEGCTSVQVTSPELGTATLDYAELDVPDLGDGSAGISVTTTATGPDGQQLTIPALIGVVQDGERAVVLVSTDTQGGTPDPADFTALLEQAYETQADALG